MEINANLIFRAGAGLFGAVLIKEGMTALRSPDTMAKNFGIPLKTPSSADYMPVMGIREMSVGASWIFLLTADAVGLLRDGSRALSLAVASGVLVALGDALLVQAKVGRGVMPHAIGASVLSVIVAGLWVTSPIA